MKKDNKGYVNIDLGNKCSKRAYDLAKTTFENRSGKAGDVCKGVDGLFSNMLDFKGVKIGITSDGIGTKAELSERCGIYDTLGFDLVAMVADDLVAGGFEPTNISNIIDADILDYDVIDGLMRGLSDACRFARISITGGEIAELGDRVSGYGNGMHFNWGSTAIGVLHEKLSKPIDGSMIREGDSVISLKSRGFRSNGFSLIRRVMTDNFGDDWHNKKYDNHQTWGEALLTPSLIYSPGICRLFDNDILPKGIAHITGGGIKDNLNRILKSTKLGANLDNLFEPHPIMKDIIKLGKISQDKAYHNWNMGNGMLIVVDKETSDTAVEVLTQKNYEAVVCGEITKGDLIIKQFK